MRKKLSLELRRELLTRTAEDYASARKGIKSQIVDQLVAATGYGRKHAITLLNHPPGSVSRHFSPMGPEKAALFGIKRFE